MQQLMINGLPGNMATLITDRLISEGRGVVPFSLTGPEISQQTVVIAGKEIRLIKPDERENAVQHLGMGSTLAIDFTHPSAAVHNAEFYCRHGVPFVMGTTGGDAQAIRRTVEGSGISAVLAPNMSAPVVLVQYMWEQAAAKFPGILDGYQLEVNESHQQSKADTSGTAKHLIKVLEGLGAGMPNPINMLRDPEKQLAIGVPQEALSGHAWHTYILTSPDATVQLGFCHNVDGRESYVDGTLLALDFLERAPEGGKLYSMTDVMSGKY